MEKYYIALHCIALHRIVFVFLLHCKGFHGTKNNTRFVTYVSLQESITRSGESTVLRG